MILTRATFWPGLWTTSESTTMLSHLLRLLGLAALLCRLTSRFDMNEDGAVYAEVTAWQLDEQLWPQP